MCEHCTDNCARLREIIELVGTEYNPAAYYREISARLISVMNIHGEVDDLLKELKESSGDPSRFRGTAFSLFEKLTLLGFCP